MNIKLDINQKMIFKYTLLVALVALPILSDMFIQQMNINVQLTVNSIFLFLIISLYERKKSFILISIISIILLFINGFNILTLIQTLEVYYIWVLYNKSNKNITIGVVMFWCLFALPLIFIINYFTGNVQSIISKLFILFICINRIFNSLISGLCLEYIPFAKIFKIPHKGIKVRRISNFLVNIGTASIVVPIVLFALATNAGNQNKSEDNAVKDLQATSLYLNEGVDSWSEADKKRLKIKDPIEINKLITLMKGYLTTSNSPATVYLIDIDNKVITNEKENNYIGQGLDWLKEGSVYELSKDTYKWVAPREENFIIKNYAREQAYFLVTSIKGLKVIITTTESKYVNADMDRYLSILNILVPLSISFGIFVIILKRYTINSISKLINITNGLPEKLKSNDTITFEKSNIYEVDCLTDNFQTMVDNLSDMILNVENANKKLRESEQKLYEQANFDFLTGLPNRHYFIRYVEEIINNFNIKKEYEGMDGIALFFIDLDKFKIINDTKGHSAGDIILKEVAMRMKDATKEQGNSRVFVARLGGDEFVIEFLYRDKDEVVALANAITEVINAPISIQNNDYNVGCSIGIGLYPEDGEDIETLFMKSDAAMYKAKYSGGNRFVFHS